jgi:hypothetical protein
VDIDSVADELYSLPPEEFTASRNAREKEAKSAGDKSDKSLAAAIHQLGKPSTAAWLVNQLVREHPDEVQGFLDLGVALREATVMLNGDQLRELGRHRHRLVYALMQQVRALAGAAGHKVSQTTARAVEDTLHAALADQAAAEELSAGRLTDTLQRTGFPPAHNTPEPASPAPVSPSPDDSTESAEALQAARLGRAERDEQQARGAVQEAVRDQEKARAVADRAVAAARDATALVARLRADLDQAQAQHSRREQEQRSAQADSERADRASQEAARRLDGAVQRRLSVEDSALRDA